MQIELAVQSFLKQHWDRTSPLLLGYSGGPDSKALLYALHAARVPLHIAHIDHGWRSESLREAELCCHEALHLNYPFHSLRLTAQALQNREEVAREARTAFFFSLFQKIPFQALLLAHHSDDLAETVLKRILEGASLFSLGGMRPLSTQGTLPIWRPLLSVSKQKILAYLEKKRLTAFEDPTNQDPSFLRSRFRHTFLPYARQALGKEVTKNLCLLSERTIELDLYLHKKLSPLLDSLLNTPLTSLPATLLAPLERLERRYLLKKILQYKQLPLARDPLEKILDWLDQKGPPRQLEQPLFTLQVHQGALSIFQKNLCAQTT